MSRSAPEHRKAYQREYYLRHRERILAQQKEYRVKRDGPGGPPRQARPADCHPDRPNHGNGQCKRCYQREWFRKYGYTPKPRKPQPVGVWPQDVVRVPVKGWGCL
jgi:hypothetical protein